MKQKHEVRRSFLKTLLAGSATAAVAAIGAKSAKAAKTVAEKKRPDEVLYRETEEFKRYYETL